MLLLVGGEWGGGCWGLGGNPLVNPQSVTSGTGGGGGGGVPGAEEKSKEGKREGRQRVKGREGER